MPIIFLFNFLWPGSGPPGARGPRFIEPPEPPVATPLMTMDNISIMCPNLCYVASEHESYLKYRFFCTCLLLMVVNMYKHIGKVVIKILQGSAVTQTALGGLTIHLLDANCL